MIRRLTQLAVVTVCAAGIASGAAAAEKKAFPDYVGEMVKVTRVAIETIDMQGYLDVVKNPGDALIVDIREPEEWASGHVPGAVHVPRGLLEWRIWKHVGFPDNPQMSRTIYVQCKTGGRATFAAKRLQELGFRNAVAVIADIREWEEKGYPLVKEN